MDKYFSAVRNAVMHFKHDMQHTTLLSLKKGGFLFLLPKLLKEFTMFYLEWLLFSLAVEEPLEMVLTKGPLFYENIMF